MKNADAPGLIARKAAELCQALQFTCTANNQTIHLSASIGVAVWRAGDKTLEQLYAEADSAVYAAKQAGRSRVRISGGGADAAASEESGRGEEGAGPVQLRSLLEYMVVHLEQVRRKTAARATVARLDYRDYAERRQRALAQQDRISRKEHADFAEKQARWRRLYQQVDAAQAAVPRGDPAGGRLLKKKMHSVQAQGRRLEREEERLTPQADFEEAILPRWSADVALPEGKVVLDLRLPALRAGDRLLARGVRLFVRGPRRVGIIGANGAGKTTLLRLIAAELLPRRDLAVSYMPQDYREALPGEMTPVEYLAPQGDKAAVTFARTCLGSMAADKILALLTVFFSPSACYTRRQIHSEGGSDMVSSFSVFCSTVSECHRLACSRPTRPHPKGTLSRAAPARAHGASFSA